MYDFLYEYPEFLSDNYGIAYLPELNWYYSSSGIFYSPDLESLAEQAADRDTKVELYCNDDKYHNSTRNTVDEANYNICIDPDGDLDIKNDNFDGDTLEDFVASLEGVYVIYKKAPVGLRGRKKTKKSEIK